MRQIPVCRTCLNVLDLVTPATTEAVFAPDGAIEGCATCGEPTELRVTPQRVHGDALQLDVDLTQEITRIALGGWLGEAGVDVVADEVVALDLLPQPFILDLSELDGIDPAGLAALDQAIGMMLDAGALVGLVPPTTGGPTIGGAYGGRFAFAEVGDATASVLVVDDELDEVIVRLRDAAASLGPGRRSPP